MRLNATRVPTGLPCDWASASQRGDEAGAHLEEVHGVRALTRGQRGGAARQGARQGGAQLGQVHGRAGRVDAQSGPEESGGGARPLRGGRTRFEAHRLHDVVWRAQEEPSQGDSVCFLLRGSEKRESTWSATSL